jgi:hypothetical protein
MIRVLFLLAMFVSPMLAAEVPDPVPEAKAELPLFIIHFTRPFYNGCLP